MSDQHVLANSDLEDEGEADNFPPFENGGIRKNLLDDFADLAKPDSSVSINGRELMKVYLRIRPFTEEELEDKMGQRCMETDGESAILLNAPKDSFTFKNEKRGREVTHCFTFSHVFGPDTSQKDFFDDTTLDLVKDFVDGQNCLVFTYGVTNSGKTYTIQGIPKDGGILPRTLDVLFNSIKDRQYPRMNLKPRYFCDVVKISEKQEHMESVLLNGLLMSLNKEQFDLNSFLQLEESNNDISKTSTVDESSLHASLKSLDGNNTDNDDNACNDDDDTSRVTDSTSINVDAQGPVMFSVWVSFAEVYNEMIFDLLEPCPEGKGKKRTTLKLGDDKNGNPYVKGLREVCVSSSEEAYRILRVGKKNQRIASTKLNQSSSRSHCVFSIKVLRVVDVENPHVARVSRLSFVDLAGSERYTKTQSTGDRLKESGNINTSLMTLGKCLECLRHNQMHQNHPQIIPFRESKLTRLFQGFFCGKGKASMIVNINQCALTFDETYHALKFSAIAKQVTTRVSKPTDMGPPAEEKSFRPSFAFSSNSKVPRVSFAWEDGSLMTPITGHCDFGDVGGNEHKVTAYIQQLESLVKQFREELIEEKKSKATLELKIREDVCSEMAGQLVAIETAYSERIQEEVSVVEERCDRRIELLTKSIKKTRKRARIERDNEDDELKTEQDKNKELTSQIEELESNIKSMKTALEDDEKRFKEQEDIMVELQSGLETSSKELEIAKLKIDKRDRTLKEKDFKIEELQTRIDDLTKEAQIQKETHEELQEKLEDANIKTSAIEDLSHVVNKLESNLTEQQQMISKKSQELQESFEKIARLEKEKETMLDEKEGWVADLGRKNKYLEEKLEETEKKLQDFSAILEQNQESGKQMEEGIHEKDEVIAEKVELLEKKDALINTLENNLKEHQQALDDNESFLEQLNNQVKQLTSDLIDAKNKQHENEENQKDVKLETALTRKISKLREQLLARDELMKELVQSLEETRSQVELEKGDLVMVCNEQKEKIGQLQEELERERNTKAAIHDSDEEMEALKKKLQKAVNESTSAKEEVETSSFEKEELQLALDAANLKVSKLEEDLKAKADTVTNSLSEANVKISSLNEALQKKGEEIDALQNELESRSSALGKVKEENEMAKTLFKKMEDEVSKQEKGLNDLEQLKAGLSEENKTILEELTRKDTELNKLVSEFENLTQELQKSVQANKDLQAKLTAAEKTIAKYGEKDSYLGNEETSTTEIETASLTDLKELEKQLKATTIALDKKNSQLIARNNTVKRLELSVSEKDAKISELTKSSTTSGTPGRDFRSREEIKTLRKRLVQADNDVKEQKQRVQECNRKMEELTEKADKNQSELSQALGKVHELEEKLSAAEKERDDGYSKYTHVGEQLEANKVQLDLYLGQQREANERFQETERELQKLKKDSAKDAEKLKEAETLRKELNEKTRELDDVKARVSDYEKTITEVERQHSEKMKENKDSNERFLETERELQKWKEDSAKDAEKLKEAAETLRKELDAKTRELGDVKARVNDYEKTITEVEKQHSEKMKENKDSMALLLERVKKAEMSNEEKVKAWDTLAELQEVIKERGETIDSLEDKLSKEEARHSREKTTLENTVAKMKDVMETKGGDRRKNLAQIKELENKLQAMTEKNEVLIKAYENYEQDVGALKKVLEQQDAVMEDQQEALNERQAEIESLISDNTRLRELNSAKDTKGDDTSAEIRQLQETLSLVKQEKVKLEERLQNAMDKQQEFDNICQLKDVDIRTANEEKATMLNAMREALSVAATKKDEFQSKMAEVKEEHAKELERLRLKYESTTTAPLELVKHDTAKPSQCSSSSKKNIEELAKQRESITMLKEVKVAIIPLADKTSPQTLPSSKKEGCNTRRPTTRSRKTDAKQDKNCASAESNDENAEDKENTKVLRNVSSVDKTKKSNEKDVSRNENMKDSEEDVSRSVTSVTDSSIKILKDEPIPDDRIEIDVTPIQRRKRASRVPGGSKTKPKKRRSSELPLSEIKQQMAAKQSAEQSEEDFTPISITGTGTRRTRASSMRSSSSCSSKKQRLPPTPLTPMNEDNIVRDEPKMTSTKKKRFLGKLFSSSGGSDTEENTPLPPKSKGRRLLKKDISAPMDSFSPCIDSFNTGTKGDKNKARSIITRQLRSRVIKQ